MFLKIKQMVPFAFFHNSKILSRTSTYSLTPFTHSYIIWLVFFFFCTFSFFLFFFALKNCTDNALGICAPLLMTAHKGYQDNALKSLNNIILWIAQGLFIQYFSKRKGLYSYFEYHVKIRFLEEAIREDVSCLFFLSWFYKVLLPLPKTSVLEIIINSAGNWQHWSLFTLLE